MKMNMFLVTEDGLSHRPRSLVFISRGVVWGMAAPSGEDLILERADRHGILSDWEEQVPCEETWGLDAFVLGQI